MAYQSTKSEELQAAIVKRTQLHKIAFCYASMDAAHAELTMGLLRDHSFDVIYDGAFLPIQSWQRIMEGLIHDADAVVAQFSSHAVESDHFMGEVSLASELGKLFVVHVPGFHPASELPLSFRQIRSVCTCHDKELVAKLHKFCSLRRAGLANVSVPKAQPRTAYRHPR